MEWAAAVRGVHSEGGTLQGVGILQVLEAGGMGCVFRGAGCSLQGRMWRRAGWQDRFQCGQEAGTLGKTQGKGAVMQERAGTGHLC